VKNKTDLELMQLVIIKHRPALEELYDRYVKLVYSFAMKSTKDEQQARIIVQSVFTRLWTTRTGYDPSKGEYINWLITVTRNITIDHIRKQRRDQTAVTMDPEIWEVMPDRTENTPEHIVSQKLIREQVKRSYQYLSKSQVELIQCLYWEGYSLREIAQMRNEPVGTVKSRLHQTLKILRNHLVHEKEET